MIRPFLHSRPFVALAGLAVLAASAAAQSVGSLPKQQQRRQQQQFVFGMDGELLGADEQALGGKATSPWSAPMSAALARTSVFEITLAQTGTGWEERFLLGYPRRPLVPAPVLVLFHGYGEDPQDLLVETTYFREALRRGWIVVAPLGAHQYNFGIEYAQRNVEQVFDWLAAYLLIDPERIYGVGFSMGGGALASYAARHVDPTRARFAALVDHTGTMSLRDSYVHAPSLFASPLMFGGDPSRLPFRYARCSVIDFDAASSTVDQATDMTRNLAHLPVRIFAAAGDPNAYILHQTDQFHEQLVARGGASDYTLSSDTLHSWSTLDERAVLDHLEPLRLADPAASGLVETLADRDGRWFHFDLTQVQAGSFSPFRWTIPAGLNRIYLDQLRNVASIGFDPVEAGLDPTEPLELVIASLEPGTVEVVLRGYSQAPVVTRGGAVGTWTYDPAAGTVTLLESDSAGYPLWTIAP